MSQYTRMAEEAGDRYLAAVAASQEGFLQMLGALAKFGPRPPSLTADFSGLREMSRAGFAFSEKLLEQQKAFADRLLAEAVPSPDVPAAVGPALGAAQTGSAAGTGEPALAEGAADGETTGN